ncbi:hypothetical protein BDZ90DRAFT_258521 [Jaminaea rosea]|uniref:Uncharacterized protein n=1 Tax=Jaminaea rosea TaxID=1569628 RepID=A0A316UXU4_9BASI|nr:hypothetical protein BDZ90DRAFT_258521 [Jaminaea rosea]PWN29608.1 hypothetical protein BDZ90DRAFT_258521 [Jaminaea rosea]
MSMLLFAYLVFASPAISGFLSSAADPAGWDDCLSAGTQCIQTAPGISVTGAEYQGRTNGSDLTNWIVAPNGASGVIKGCYGEATWSSQEMGDTVFDGTKQGRGRLQAWFSLSPGDKVTNAVIRSSMSGDDLTVICEDPPREGSPHEAELMEDTLLEGL